MLAKSSLSSVSRKDKAAVVRGNSIGTRHTEVAAHFALQRARSFCRYHHGGSFRLFNKNCRVE